MTALATLRDLMIDELRDLYSAEHQLVKLLPQMARAASAPALRLALDRHLTQTVNQALRLDRIIVRLLGVDPRGRRCRGMEGLVAQARDMLEQEPIGGVMDAAIVAAGQRIEHYQIAAYECSRRRALVLGRPDVADFLQQSLEEEQAAEELLTALAAHELDAFAAEAPEGPRQWEA
jgi:ferritin-like metal-binding protein YciE